MSSNNNKEIKNENIIEKEKIKEEKTFSIKKSKMATKEKIFEEPENIEKNRIQSSHANFILDFEKKEKLELENKDSKKGNKNRIIDCSSLILNNDSPENNNGLNPHKTQNENTNNNNQNNKNNPSLMQRTKSWMTNMWANVKNYNYGKFNIFKRTEMEDCLDAHGFPIRIPKKRKEEKLVKKIEGDKDFMKYNNLNYNRYYSNGNANIFAGYPY